MPHDVVSDCSKQNDNRTTHAPLLDVDELSAGLKVPKSWIYGKTRETGPGSIPRLKVGKYLRFRMPEVLAWLETQNMKGN